MGQATRGARGVGTGPRLALVVILVLAAPGLAGCELAARYFMETKALTTGPNGPQTPQTVGVPFDRVQIASGARHLDSYVVTAPPRCRNPPLILIYHGVQETISYWVQAQKFLFDRCVSSVVFDYTGSGDSSRPARYEDVNDDAVAAYDAMRRRFPGAAIFVMGHSMGSGPMLQAVPRFAAPPAGVIVASAFSSLRDFGGRAGGFYGLLAGFSPDWWNNVSAIARIRAPVLVVHSDADQVNPLSEGQQIFAAANEPKTMVVAHGFSHNALYRAPSEDWWRPVLAFVGAPVPSQ